MSEPQVVLKVWFRRNRVDYMTKEEKALLDARIAINKLGCNPLVRESVNLIRQAQDKLADFVEAGADTRGRLPTVHTPASCQEKLAQGTETVKQLA